MKKTTALLFTVLAAAPGCQLLKQAQQEQPQQGQTTTLVQTAPVAAAPVAAAPAAAAPAVSADEMESDGKADIHTISKLSFKTNPDPSCVDPKTHKPGKTYELESPDRGNNLFKDQGKPTPPPWKASIDASEKKLVDQINAATAADHDIRLYYHQQLVTPDTICSGLAEYHITGFVDRTALKQKDQSDADTRAAIRKERAAAAVRAASAKQQRP